MTVGSSDYLGDKDPARPRLTILLWHETAAGSSSLTFPRPGGGGGGDKTACHVICRNPGTS